MGPPNLGAWWVSDARTLSMAVLLFLYLGVIALRRALGAQAVAPRACAMLVLIGLVNIPIIKYSVNWWLTLHQPATRLRFSGHGHSTRRHREARPSRAVSGSRQRRRISRDLTRRLAGTRRRSKSWHESPSLEVRLLPKATWKSRPESCNSARLIHATMASARLTAGEAWPRPYGPCLV